MSFQIIVPHEFTEAELTGSTISLADDWAASTAYAIGDIVAHAHPVGVTSQFSKGEYECVATIDGTTAPQSTAAPPDSESFWVYLGPENRHRAFDVQVGVDQDRVIETVSSKVNDIVFDGKISTPIQGVAFINVTAIEGDFIAPVFGGADDGEGGTIPTTSSDFSFDFLDRSGVRSSFYNWLTKPIIRQKNRVFLNLNVMANVNFGIRLRGESFFDFDGPDKLVEVGAIVMGRVHEIGTTSLDAGWRLNSRSFKSFDGFKNSLVRRLPGNSIVSEIKINSGDEEYTRLLLEQLDSKAAVFIPFEDRPDLTVYGVLTNVQTTARTKDHTFLSLEVESL